MNPSLLDLVITNEENTILNIHSTEPLGKSDHIVLIIEYCCQLVVPVATYTRYLYDKGDYELINKDLFNEDWMVLFQDLNVSAMWEIFHSKLLYLMNKYIPSINFSSTKVRSHPLWLNKEILRDIKLKHKAWNKYLFTRQKSDFDAYSKIRNHSTFMVRKSRLLFEAKLATNVKVNPKKFWSYVNQTIKVKPGVSTLEREDGTVIEKDADIAEALNDYFCSVFTRENLDSIPSLPPRISGISLTDIQMTSQEVLQQLLRLKPHKSAGPDQCHPCVLYNIRESLVAPLTLIYDKSLKDGILPDCWKEATVVAIHKKGSKRDVRNYRPVSLTSVICKMLEAIIKNHILHHLELHSLLSDHQYGFRPGRSCELQLLRIVNEWTLCLDERKPIDILYLDFQKAFDKVPHIRLISKLQAYGIDGNLLSWINSFLSNRRQRVCVRGSFSEWSQVISGVPQGSVLGPILFILYINDLSEQIQSSLWTFADDTKIYRPILTTEDQNILQKDLDISTQWNKTWQGFLNISKCKHLSLGGPSTNRTYTIKNDLEDVIIQQTREERDLGITFTNDFKFSKHINLSIRKANKMLGIVYRSFQNLTPTIFRMLYVSLVRPHLDYASVVWNPHLLKDIRALEAVQRRATRMVPQFGTMTYVERLTFLNLPSLYYRRRRMDMIITYKIIHGLVCVPCSEFFVFNLGITRSNGLKLSKEHVNTNVRLQCFKNRIINDWNSLPSDIVNAPDVLVFKTLLDNYWKNLRFLIL